MNKWLNILLIDLSALLLGVVLTFAFAPYEIFPLAVMAPAALLALWLHVSPKRAAFLGLVFGMGYFGAGVYWVYHSVHTFGDVSVFLSVIVTGALIFFLSLFPALTGYVTNRYFPVNSTAKLVYAFPAIWVATEWLRSCLFTGFPWLLVGYSQSNSPLKGYAAVLSVFGVSLAVIMSSALLVNAWLQYKGKNYRSLYLNVFAVIVIWTVGNLLSLIPWTRPIGNPVTVALVQGNIPQALKWSPEHLNLSLDTYAKLTEPLWGKNTLIIWPEAAVPLPIHEAAPFIQDMDNKARASGSTLLLGVPIELPNGGFYNAIVALGGDDKQLYAKRLLVPFGEYIPLTGLLSNLLNFMKVPLPDTVAGKPNQGPMLIGDLKILPSICYEIAFPELFKTDDKSISMLLTLTNDAWFGESNAEAQHLQMAQMRAMELGRPALFVSNDGITAIIDPYGKIEETAPQREALVLKGTIQPRFGATPWMTNQMNSIILILSCLVIAAVRARQRQDGTADKKKLLADAAEEQR